MIMADLFHTIAENFFPYVIYCEVVLVLCEVFIGACLNAFGRTEAVVVTNIS